MKRQILNSAVAAVALFAACSLRADTISYNLTVGNSAISGYTGPYGSVLVNRTDSTHATITFSASTVGGFSFLFGGQGVAAVNVNAASWSIGSMTGSNAGSGFTPGPLSNGGANTEDGFGTYNQTLDSFDGYTHSFSTLSFILTDTSGSWGSAADVLRGVAAHIFVTTNPADASNGAVATGYGANGVGVPDGGSTVALLGCGLAGLGMISRKFRKN
jgi:hypothetical protein